MAVEPTSGMLALIKWTCAASAACLAETVTMPLDVTKTRLQLQNELVVKNKHSKQPAKGMIATATGIYTNEGFRSLFKGLTAGVLRQSLCAGIGIGLYPSVKTWVQMKRGGQEVPLPFKIISASLCGVIGQAIASPTDVVKVRLQADARLQKHGVIPRYHNTLDAFIKIPQQEGFISLYRGMAPSLLRAIAMYGASVPTYDTVKHYIVATMFDDDVNQGDRMGVHMASSLCSGFVASVVSTPFDTVKTRIINQPSSSIKPQHHPITHKSHLPSHVKSHIHPSPSHHTSTSTTSITSLPTHTHTSHPTTSHTPSHPTTATHAQPHHSITTATLPHQTPITLTSTSSSHIPSTPTPSPTPPTPLYRGPWDCAVKTMRAEGVFGLYKGFIPTYTRLGPWQLVFFVAFEQLNIMMTGHSMR